MTQTHDIFLRAYAVAMDKKEKQKRSAHVGDDPKWAQHALVLDTETRITADQSLTFGVYRLCALVADIYTVTEEGIFYPDDLRAKERKVLESYIKTAVSDVASFPPRFPLYSRSDFMKRVFKPAIKRDGASICGLNLPFDLSRLALDWSKGNDNEWSLTMAQYPDGTENRNYPRILITPIDGKKAFIKLAPPWKPEEWKSDSKTHFLDLRTLAWALFNKSFSLKRACNELNTEHKKLEDHEPTGKVTREEIDYARQDVRCTVDVLNALKQEFDKHPIDLKPYNAYSPASVAKAYLDQMGIMRPAEKFRVPKKALGVSMQSYYGGRSETRIRCADVPVVPVDFTSEYPSCCALFGLFDVLTAKRISFDDDTENVRRFLKRSTLKGCFSPEMWRRSQFFALVKPDDDILPVRTMYNGVTQNIGNNYLTSDAAIWFAGPDLIASVIRTGKVPHIIRAVRMVPHGKQTGMRSVNLRGMVKIDPHKNDLFRTIIEQRKLHKADKALYYWLKILANSIYGFFVELIPEIQNKDAAVRVFSGEKNFKDVSDVIENSGHWFFPPLASLITAGGRLLLAMTEACVQEQRGSYLFCDTDSLAIVASRRGGKLRIPGSEGIRILSWAEVQEIVDKFAALNPYNRNIVKGSILNLVDANYVDSDPKNPQRQLYGYSIAAKRYALYEKIGEKDIQIVDPKAHGIGFLYPPKDSPKNWKGDAPQWIYEMWDYILRGVLKLRRKAPSWLNVPQMMRLTITTYNVLDMLGEWEIARPYNFLLLPMVDPTFGYAFHKRANEKVRLVAAFSSKQERWFGMKCENIHSGKRYRMVDCTKEINLSHNVVFPSQFARLLVEYQEHPEAKSLAPDDTPCEPDTSGLLKRAHVIAGELRYVGKETDRKWEEGDDISVVEFKATEYGRTKKVIAETSLADEIRAIGIRKTIELTKMSQHTIEKLLRREAVKRKTHEHVLRAIQTYKSFQ
jgi:DNA polymerase type B, organellar and viral